MRMLRRYFVASVLPLLFSLTLSGCYEYFGNPIGRWPIPDRGSIRAVVRCLSKWKAATDPTTGTVGRSFNACRSRG
jgi:hypothetical protein